MATSTSFFVVVNKEKTKAIVIIIEEEYLVCKNLGKYIIKGLDDNKKYIVKINNKEYNEEGRLLNNIGISLDVMFDNKNNKDSRILTLVVNIEEDNG